MQKPARNDVPIHELLRQRWSPRAFADQAMPEEVLRSLFEAARWAPSSFNEQPWAYIVATKEDKVNFEKVLGTLVEFNAELRGRLKKLGFLTRNTTQEPLRPCCRWRPRHAAWRFTRWPASTRTKRERLSPSRKGGSPWRSSPSAIRETRTPCLQSYGTENWRLGRASRSVNS